MKIGLTYIFYKNIKLFTSWLQRVVTNTLYSHVSTYTGFTALGLEQEFDADLEVRFHTFRKSANMDFISWKDVPAEVGINVVTEVAKLFEGDVYGLGSWLTTFIRFALQRLGFKNMHKRRIWIGWKWGKSCSELKWYEMAWIAYEMRYGDIYTKLCEYNPETFCPQDIDDLATWFPQYLIKGELK